VHEWVEQTRRGSIRAASRLISLLEREPHRLPEMLSGMGDWPQPRLILGLTGPPGVGKSTLSDAMITCFRQRHPDRKIGVLAVDPSSPFSGGSILGDRVRMMDHATDPNVYIRSLASRGHLGGLSLGIKGAIRVLGLFGCDIVMLETVGVGQSEVEVMEVADLTAIALAPGQGDGVQMLKAGLMEAGDLFIINKADRDGADRLVAELGATLKLAKPRKDGLRPPICPVSATQKDGIDALFDAIEHRAEQLAEFIADQRARSMEREVKQAVLAAAGRRLSAAFDGEDAGQARIHRILSGAATVEQMAAELLDRCVQDLEVKELP